MQLSKPHLILKMNMTLDGYVGGPSGEIDWLFPSMDAQAMAWTVDVLEGAAVHLMGHRTFQDMAAHWPVSSEPYAPAMNDKPKAVLTRREELAPDRREATLAVEQSARNLSIAERAADPAASESWESWVAPEVINDPAAGVESLKARSHGYVLAHGGAGFARSLIEADVVDEFRLLVHPVILGAGLRLSGPNPAVRRLRLADHKVFPAGAVGLTYTLER